MSLRESWPTVSRILGLALSLGLLFVVIRGVSEKAHARDLMDVWAKIDPRWLVAAEATMLVQIGVSVIRLCLVAGEVAGTSTPGFRVCGAIQWLTLFVSQGAPIAAIGEVARVAIIRSKLRLSVTDSLRVMVYDRLWGLLGMMSTGAILLLPQLTMGVDRAVIVPQVIAWVAVIGGFLVLGVLRRSASGIPWVGLRHVLLIAAGYFDSWRSTRFLVLQGACAAVYVVVAAAVFWAIARGLGLELDIFTILLFVPVILFAMSIPLFYAGWGAREAAVVGTLGHVAGIGATSALALSVGYGIVYLIASLPGGWVWAVSQTKSFPRPKGARDRQ
jgi:hypothetical protein